MAATATPWTKQSGEHVGRHSFARRYRAADESEKLSTLSTTPISKPDKRAIHPTSGPAQKALQGDCGNSDTRTPRAALLITPRTNTRGTACRTTHDTGMNKSHMKHQPQTP